MTTTELMVDASLKVQVTVGVLSLPSDSTHQVGLVQIRGDVASWMIMAASSRSEFVVHPFGLSQLIRSDTMSGGYSARQIK